MRISITIFLPLSHFFSLPIYIYIYIWTGTYTCKTTHTHTHTYIYTRTHKHTHTRTHAYIYVCVCACVCMCVCSCSVKDHRWFPFKILEWRRWTLFDIFLLSGSRCKRMYPILALAILTISMVTLRGCVSLFVAVRFIHIYLKWVFFFAFLIAGIGSSCFSGWLVIEYV